MTLFIPILKMEDYPEDWELPQLATEGAACFDIRALYPTSKDRLDVGVAVYHNAPFVFRTGLKVAVPKGYVLKIYSRSGHAFKNGVRLANCVGIIDSDYRGELMVKLQGDPAAHLIVKHGDRIAQGMFVKVEEFLWLEQNALDETKRGAGGFGSTNI